MTPARRTLAILGILMGNMAMGLSFSAINTNLESISREFGATIVQLQWIINIYGIFIASTLVAMGRLGDIFGRKRIYLVGMLFFTSSMLGAGLALTPSMIIGFQILYGLAGAILLPLSQAMLVDLYPEEKKSLAIGLWAASGGIALAMGPIIGGALLGFFSWRWMFLINVPFAVLGFSLTALFARESKTEGESTRIDWPGVILLTLGMGTFILATIQSNLWDIVVIAELYLISLAAFVLLLMVEPKMEMPIIRKELFKSRLFLSCSIGGFCMIAFFWAAIFLMPLYIQKQLDYTPLQTGALMLGFSLPVALLSPLSGRLYEKVGPRRLVCLGFFLLAISTLIQLQYTQDTSAFLIAIATLILGFGLSLIWTPTTTGALSAISSNFAGIASGTFVTVQEIGGSVGLAVTVTIVRLAPEFAEGFHRGMQVMLVVSVLGICSALFIPKVMQRECE